MESRLAYEKILHYIFCRLSPFARPLFEGIAMGAVELPSSVSSRIGHHQEHSVQFYGNDGFLIDELRQFIGSALATGCSAVVIATKAHRENLSRKLKSYGVDVSGATREERYLAYDAADVLSQFTLNNQIDPAQFTHVIGTVLTKASAASKEPNRRVVSSEKWSPCFGPRVKPRLLYS